MPAIDAGDVGLRRKHDGRGNHRPRQRPDPHFVDAGNVAHAGSPQHELEVPHGGKAQALVAFALEAFLECRVQVAHALPGIALEPAQQLCRDRLLAFNVTLPDLVDRKFVHAAWHTLSVSAGIGARKRAWFRRRALI